MSPPIHGRDVRLADACESLHMAYTGASDPLSPEERARLVEYLQTRLRGWHPSPGFTKAYDDLWRRLVEVTLEEHDRGLAEGRVM